MGKFTTKKAIGLCKTIIAIGILVLFFNNNAFADDCTPPGAKATVSGVITCSNTSVTLRGESPTVGVTYYWSGPNDFVSMFQEPAISLPGIYRLTVTNPLDGCTSVDSVEVLKDIEQPDAGATVSDVLNCANLSVTLHAATNVANADFHWIGPGSYSSYEQNPEVNVKGGYTLIVTDLNNGCASTATEYVEKDEAPPLASAYVSGELTCTENSVELTSSSPTSRTLFNWSGPGEFTSDEHNTIAMETGTYTVTVTDTVNSCISTASVEVIENIEEPGALITSTSSEITCSTVNATLSANSSAISVTYSWSGPNGFGSTVQNPVVATPGDYVLAVTRAGNGCISTDTFNISENKIRPGASAIPSGNITCSSPSITLQGSSPTSGVNYRWIGANFSSLVQNPSTLNPGPYMLIVIDPDNGCTSSTFTNVMENTTLPASVTAGNGGPLTCTVASTALAGNSTTPGVTYNWSATGFTSSEQNPIVSKADTYYLTVTDPVNGCTVEKNTIVAENLTPPADVTADNAGILTCNVENVNLSGNSTTSGVAYIWTGPENFSSTLKNPSVNVPGKYYLTVTNPDNGCKDIDSTTVAQDTISPINVVAENNGPLTCTELSVNLAGGTSTSGVIYNWTGPNDYTSSAQNPTVGIAGPYYLTVTSLANGCKSYARTDLEQDTLKPATVTAVNDGPLTCNTSEVILSGNSSTMGVIYSWIGPNDFSSNLQSPEISESGSYSLTVENPDNGCTSTIITIVEVDTVQPVAVNAVNDGPITCSDDNVLLTASSLTTGVSYSWSGPDDYVADTITPTVHQSGEYIVTVTDISNGCFAMANTFVAQDVNLPVNVAASNNGPLTCAETTVTLTGSSATGGVTYRWSGPNGFISELQSPNISESGTYNLTVEDLDNGCSVTASTLVAVDTVPPGLVLASNDGPLTCETTEVTITGSSSTLGVSYSWSGPDDFTSAEASPVITDDGTYTVIVTHPINGCTAKVSTIVDENITTPGVTSSAAGIFTCSETSLILTAISPTNNVSYSWVGPGEFTSIAQSPEITVSGFYEVTVTDPVNGCISTSSLITQQDIDIPDVSASVYDVLTCDLTAVFIQASSLTPGVEYYWIGPNDFNSTEQYPITAEPGDYTVTVTDPSNGCSSKDYLTVSADTLAPESVLATVSDIITCDTETVTLFGSSTTGGVDYSWSGPDNFASLNQNPGVNDPGFYKLTITNPVNGCFDTASVNVIKNTTPPAQVSATASSMLNCLYSSVTLMANTATENVGYKWSGPGLSSTLQSPTISLPGTYSLTVTNLSNGCFDTDLVLVTKDLTAPAGVSTSVSGDLTCENPEVIVSASSSTIGVEYSWTGPDNFVSTDQNPGVTKLGDYQVTITNPINGCIVERTLIVEQDTIAPANVVASVSGDITCSVESVNLLSSSSTNGVSFNWSSPGGFTSDIANPSVTEPDDYMLIVTDPSNGCTETRIVTVLEDNEKPADVEALVSNVLNCNTPSASLTGTSSTSGVNFEWSGPFGFTWEGASAMTFFSGEYVLKVSDPSNGCSAADTIMVYEDFVYPDVTTQGATITCNDEIVTISAGSSIPGVTYLWSDNVVLSDRELPNVEVDESGEYTITVTNPANGCPSEAKVNVGLDNTDPELTALVDGTLTCSNQSVSLSATSETPGVIITWTGYPGQNPVSVNEPGTYTVTAENPENGCDAAQDVIVSQNIIVPNLSVSSTNPHLTCLVNSADLTASTSTPGTTLQWTGFGLNENPVNTGSPGVYRVTARTTDNGCTSVDSVVITQDIQVPDLTTTGATITCGEQLVTISANSSTPNVIYLWSGSIISDPSQQDAFVISPDDYTVTVTSNINGCSNSAIVVVDQDTESPVCNIIAPSGSPVELQNNTITAQQLNDVTYSWSITAATGWSVVSGQDSDELVYLAGSAGTSETFSLKVTNNGNACFSDCSLELISIAPAAAVSMKSASENTNVLESEPEIADLSINAYPNPFVNDAWIEFTAIKDERVVIDIYSASGLLLNKLFDKEVKQSSKYKIAVNGNTMESGTYYCVIKMNNNVYTRKLILMK